MSTGNETLRTAAADVAGDGSAATVQSPGVAPAPLHGRRSRWLFIDGAGSFGGHEVMLLRWIDELRNAGVVDPRLIARQHGRLAAAAPAPTLAGVLPLSPGGSAWRAVISMWNDVRHLARHVRRERPDLCIFASGSLGDQLLLTLCTSLLGRKVVVYVPLLDTFAEMRYRASRWKDGFVRLVLARVPVAWVAISDRQAAHFREWAGPRGVVHVLPNTVGAAFETAARQMPCGIAPGRRIRVLVLGRMDAPQKGLDMLVAQMLVEPPDRLMRLDISIVGEGPYRAVLERTIEEHPELQSCLRVDRWRPTADAMAAHDVLLLPSRFEGVPLVMLEAMVLGLPVVASDLPGTRAYLPAECVFPVGDIARAITLVIALSDLDSRRRLAAQGRRVYDQTASSTIFSQNVVRLTQLLEQEFAGNGNDTERPMSLARSTPAVSELVARLQRIPRRLSRAIRQQIYKPRLVPSQHRYPLVRLGSQYGGWVFVDTQSLRNSTIISCGLGEDASFDVEIAARFDCKVLLVDPTPRAVSHFRQIARSYGTPATTAYVSGGRQPTSAYDLTKIGPHNLKLVDKALWNESTTLKFFTPEDPSHVSHSIVNFQNDYRQDSKHIEVGTITPRSLLAELDGARFALIKLDIEGAEVEVLQNMMDDKIFPQQILVEFDELCRPSKTSKARVESGHAALLRSGYRLIHFDAPSNFLYVRGLE